MKRVGIITMYHNSENYGGILQAYALAKKINLLGADARQISFDTCGNKIFAPKKSWKTSVKSFVAKCLKLLSVARVKKSRTIKKFRDAIPHTRIVNSGNIKGLLNNFDVFITGSDQVWNPSAVCKEYLLSFVPPEKTKVSYAASISRDTLTSEEQQVFKNSLDTFSDISVREQNDALLLEQCVNKKIEWVLDPVFLLSKQDWDEASSDRLIDEKYVFCYFLNDRNKNPSLIAEFARNNNSITVQIDGLSAVSKNIADKKIKNVGPKQFLSLIKHADFVLTDSFHAMAFSFLFQKNFIVFSRNNERTMETRITSFLNLINRNDLFIDAQANDINQLTRIKAVDYKTEYTDFETQKIYSVNFLKKHL